MAWFVVIEVLSDGINNVIPMMEGSTQAYLASLSSYFLSCKPLRSFNWKNKDLVSDQTGVLDATINHRLNKQLPISQKYVTAFMKQFMQTALVLQIEESGVEIHERVYESYGELLARTYSESHKHYLIDHTYTSLQEEAQLVVDGTTGMRTWQASFCMLEWLMKNRALIEDRNLLELGSGIGLLGVACCTHLKPKAYLLTDHHPRVLAALNSNIETNRPNLNTVPTAMELDWETVSADGLNPKQVSTVSQTEVVLAADVIYDPRIISPFIQSLVNLFGTCNNIQEAFIASTVRNTDTYTHFLTSLDSSPLNYEKISYTPEESNHCNEVSEVSIIKVTCHTPVDSQN